MTGKLFLMICIFFGVFSTMANAKVERLISGDFGVWVENYEGAFHYPPGFRYKIGMSADMENQPEWHSVAFGEIEGRRTTSADFQVVAMERKQEAGSVQSLVTRLRHVYLPLEATIVYAAYGQTGVITSTVILRNVSASYPIRMTKVPSVNLRFSPGEYDYSYLTSGWANERVLRTEAVGRDTVSFQSVSGRSSTDYSPWLSLHDKERDIYYNAQLAWSGNWFMRVAGAEGIQVSMGEYFDNDLLLLLPGKEIILPEVAFSGGYGSIDVPANNLHRYQRQYLLKVPKSNDPMLVQFNTWFPFQIDITEACLKPYVDEAAALGLEVFTIDAGWYVRNSFEREVGNWQTNPEKFPHGLGEIARYIRSKGMRFGLWFEIESLGEGTDILRQHPDWCLSSDGNPVICEPWSRRRHLDFSKPEVFAWALERFDTMYRECGGIDWVKLDYNISIGSRFQNREGIGTGDCLRNHILAFYTWLDTLSEKYPDLILENCSSGALRMDIGMLRHTHTSFVSDETSVHPSLGMAWSSSLEYTPRMINHWVVGMKNHLPVIDASLPRGYWDYMFRVPMNGQFGVSSRIVDWPEELKQCARENIALYKKIRRVIADADCYHLTPQPDYKEPVDWTVLAYISEDAGEAVVMANRGRGGEDHFRVKLPQLNPSAWYKLEIDGKEQGTFKGITLAREGLRVELDPYRASVIALKQK